MFPNRQLISGRDFAICSKLDELIPLLLQIVTSGKSSRRSFRKSTQLSCIGNTHR